MFSAVNTVAVSAEDLAKTTPAEFGAAMVASLNLQVGGQGTNPSIVSITVTISETVELQVDAGPSLSSSNLLAATKAAACTGMAGTCSVSNLQGRRQLRHAGARREGREEFALGGRELALGDRELALGGRELALEGRELALGDRTLEARRRLGTGLTVTREYDYGASANSSTSVSALIESSLEDVDVTSSVMTALSARSAVTALAEGDGSGSDVAGQLDASSLTDMLALLLPSVGVDVSEPLVVTPPAAPPHPSPLPPPAYPGPSAPPARPETVAQLTLFISLLACGLAVLLAIVGVALWLGCRSHRPPTSVRVLPNTRGAGGTKTQEAQGPSRVQGAGYRVQEAQGPSSPSRARHEGAWLASKGLGAAGDHVMDVAGTGYRVQGKGLGAAGDHVMDVAAVSVSSAASARDGVTAAASVSSAATGPRPTYDETTPYVADGYARGEMAGGGGVGLEDGRAASQPARPPRYDREGVEIVEIDDAHPEPPPSPAPLVTRPSSRDAWRKEPVEAHGRPWKEPDEIDQIAEIARVGDGGTSCSPRSRSRSPPTRAPPSLPPRHAHPHPAPSGRSCVGQTNEEVAAGTQAEHLAKEIAKEKRKQLERRLKQARLRLQAATLTAERVHVHAAQQQASEMSAGVGTSEMSAGVGTSEMSAGVGTSAGGYLSTPRYRRAPPVLANAGIGAGASETGLPGPWTLEPVATGMGLAADAGCTGAGARDTVQGTGSQGDAWAAAACAAGPGVAASRDLEARLAPGPRDLAPGPRDLAPGPRDLEARLARARQRLQAATKEASLARATYTHAVTQAAITRRQAAPSAASPSGTPRVMIDERMQRVEAMEGTAPHAATQAAITPRPAAAPSAASPSGTPRVMIDERMQRVEAKEGTAPQSPSSPRKGATLGSASDTAGHTYF